MDFISSKVGTDVKVLEPENSPAVKGPAKLVSFTQSLQHKDTAVCHRLGFPSQLYWCHIVTKTKVVEGVPTATEGSVTRAVGVRDTDTTTWVPNHEAFTILKVQPGLPVCHWVDSEASVWVATK